MGYGGIEIEDVEVWVIYGRDMGGIQRGMNGI